jgi:hypothetical protein
MKIILKAGLFAAGVWVVSTLVLGWLRLPDWLAWVTAGIALFTVKFPVNPA